jgi:UDP-glucose:(heptosyl)LPS alpha-1,3-glucosyltransferase
MNKRLSIAMAIYRLSPRGGLEDNCLRMAHVLAERGHKLVIYTAEPDEVAGMDIRPIPEATRPASNHRRMETLSRLAGQAIKDGNFDCSIAFQMMPGTDYVFLADPIRQLSGRNIWKWLTPRYHVYKSLEARTLGRNSRSRIIGLSERQMQAFARHYILPPDRYRIAPPTLDTAKIHPEVRNPQIRAQARRKLGIPDQAPVLMAAALQAWTKGLDRTIAALEQLPDAVLLVAGMEKSGPMAADSVRMAGSSGVLDRIRFLGFLEPDKLLETMAAADVLAHPARRDVTGAVILESIVNGLPVVATDVCGFSVHIERSKAGEVLAGPFSGSAYVGALKRVLSASPTMTDNAKAYGSDPWLSSGIDKVCDWIENGF